MDLVEHRLAENAEEAIVGRGGGNGNAFYQPFDGLMELKVVMTFCNLCFCLFHFFFFSLFSLLTVRVQSRLCNYLIINDFKLATCFVRRFSSPIVCSLLRRGISLSGGSAAAPAVLRQQNCAVLINYN